MANIYNLLNDKKTELDAQITSVSFIPWVKKYNKTPLNKVV